jgi:tRNA-guanine transglycosylase
MIKPFFTVKKKSAISNARLGEINTIHGQVQTPAFVGVATKASLKSLTPKQLKRIGTQLAFVNTYHLVTHPGVDLIAKAGGVHQFAKLTLPLMSDSGGFQVFSLAQNKRQAQVRGEEQPLVVKISADGVIFRSIYDGKKIEFTPEKSIEYQHKIGADIMMAFDECTYYPSSQAYTQKAMERTHQWLKRCINYHNTYSPQHYSQFLYGVIQGGAFVNLRQQSAQFISTQAVDGVAIGGVSVGETKKEMRDQVKWVAPYLPSDKPVHLLGVGGFDDILDLVGYGIDTFDCVEPTRLARMGILYDWQSIIQYLKKRGLFISTHVSRIGSRPVVKSGDNNFIFSDIKKDITQSMYKTDLSPFNIDCDCYSCRNLTKAYLHHLFKQKELLGYTLATIHNLTVMEKYFALIRELIAQDRL